MMLPRRWTGHLALLIALLVLLVAAPATAWFSTSRSLSYTITAGTWEDDPTEDDEDDDEDDGSDPDDDPDPDEGDDDADFEQVWACKLTGQPGAPQLKPGPNPIQVAGAATIDGRLDDEHGSPVVADSGADCAAILAELSGASEDGSGDGAADMDTVIDPDGDKVTDDADVDAPVDAMNGQQEPDQDDEHDGVGAEQHPSAEGDTSERDALSSSG